MTGPTEIGAIHGLPGIRALLDAFGGSNTSYTLKIEIAQHYVTHQHVLLVTIEQVTALLTIPEVRWFARKLIHESGGMGLVSDDLSELGRQIQSVLDHEVPPEDRRDLH